MFEIPEVTSAALSLFSDKASTADEFSSRASTADRFSCKASAAAELSSGASAADGFSSRANAADKFILHVAWEYDANSFEIIVAALLLDENEKLLGLVTDRKAGPGIRLLRKVSKNKVDFLFEVDEGALQAEKIRFIAVVGSSRLYGQTFIDVSAPAIKLIDGNTYKIKSSIPVAAIDRRSTAIAIGDYTKDKGFIGLGKGYNYSLADYVKFYGGSADGDF